MLRNIRTLLLALGLLAVVGLLTAWALANVRTGPPLFEATARFQARNDEDLYTNNQSKVIAEIYGPIRQLREYNITGRPALEQMASDLRLREGLPHTADGEMTTEGKAVYTTMLETMQRHITLKVEVDSPEREFLAVTVRHPDRELAVKIANKLIENYMMKVRAEIDDSLLDSKKYFDNEVVRLRRKVSDLETAMVRFRLSLAPLFEVFPQMDILSEQAAIDVFLEPARRKKSLAVASRRLDRLKELAKDKTIDGVLILEMARLQETIESDQAVLKQLEDAKGAFDEYNRNWFTIRNDASKITRELAEAKAQLTHWEERLREVQIALTLAVGDRGMRLSFVERAAEAKAVK